MSSERKWHLTPRITGENGFLFWLLWAGNRRGRCESEAGSLRDVDAGPHSPGLFKGMNLRRPVWTGAQGLSKPPSHGLDWGRIGPCWMWTGAIRLTEEGVPESLLALRFEEESCVIVPLISRVRLQGNPVIDRSKRSPRRDSTG